MSLFLLGLLFLASERMLNGFDYRKPERSVLTAELNIDEIKAQSQVDVLVNSLLHSETLHDEVQKSWLYHGSCVHPTVALCV